MSVRPEAVPRSSSWAHEWQARAEKVNWHEAVVHIVVVDVVQAKFLVGEA